MISGFVRGQKLELTQPLVVSDTIDYLEAVFHFQTADWAGRSVWAHFTQGETSYKINLHGGKILTSDHLNLGAGTWEIYLHGTAPDGSRITTNVVTLTVEKTGPMEGDPLGETPLGPLEQIDARVTKLEQAGPSGPDGGGGGGPSDAVRYGGPQKLSEAQKGQARRNIDAASVADVPKTAVLFTPQELTPEQQKQAQKNIGVTGGGATQTFTEESYTNVTARETPFTLPDNIETQTVNLYWDIPQGGGSAPAFTNYLIAKKPFPITLNKPAFTQLWAENGFGDESQFVKGHKYFLGFHYTVRSGDFTIDTNGTNPVTTTGTAILTGSGWAYMSKIINQTATTSALYARVKIECDATIDKLYAIDVTKLLEAGSIESDNMDYLVETFAELDLVPGQDYAGGGGSGKPAKFVVKRGGSTIDVPKEQETLEVQPGDIVSATGCMVTFIVKGTAEVPKFTPGIWKNKKWVAIGDSLTDESINAKRKYMRCIQDRTDIDVLVLGKGGSGYYEGYDKGVSYGIRARQTPPDADVVTMFGSVNDWKALNANTIQVGSPADTIETGTLSGYINDAIDTVISKAPYAQIAIVSPMPYKGIKKVAEITEALRQVAEYRGLKYLDMFNHSGFRISDPVFAKEYTVDYAPGEGYGHPSNLAHQRLVAPEFMELLKRMLL